MSEEIKSGKEILDEFFIEIDTFDDIDKNIVKIITGLYKENNLSEKSISNALLDLREKTDNG